MTFHAFVLFVWEYEIYNRANIMIHHFIFVFFLYFFYHSSCRKDQFTVLSLKFGTQDFNWSRSTKDPAEPHWFVVVVLPCVCVLPKCFCEWGTSFSLASQYCHSKMIFTGGAISSVWGEKWTKKKMLMVLLQKHVWEPGARVGKGKTKTNFRWTHRDVVTIPWSHAPCQFPSSLSFCQPPAEATWSVLKFPIRKPRNGESQIKMILTILF